MSRSRYAYAKLIRTNVPYYGSASLHGDGFHPRPGRGHIAATFAMKPFRRPTGVPAPLATLLALQDVDEPGQSEGEPDQQSWKCPSTVQNAHTPACLWQVRLS